MYRPPDVSEAAANRSQSARTESPARTPNIRGNNYCAAGDCGHVSQAQGLKSISETGVKAKTQAKAHFVGQFRKSSAIADWGGGAERTRTSTRRAARSG